MKPAMHIYCQYNTNTHIYADVRSCHASCWPAYQKHILLIPWERYQEYLSQGYFDMQPRKLGNWTGGHVITDPLYLSHTWLMLVSKVFRWKPGLMTVLVQIFPLGLLWLNIRNSHICWCIITTSTTKKSRLYDSS